MLLLRLLRLPSRLYFRLVAGREKEMRILYGVIAIRRSISRCLLELSFHGSSGVSGHERESTPCVNHRGA